MLKKISAILLLSSVLVTAISCSDSDNNHHSNYGYNSYTDYDPYAARYYRQDRYWSHGSYARHQVDCVYDDQYNRYVMRKYQGHSYDNRSCKTINNFITNNNYYSNYGFTPYYISTGCPTSYYPVYYGYSLFCSPQYYYNQWNSYIGLYGYLGFFAWLGTL